MDNDNLDQNKDTELTAEEKQSEQEALSEVKEEELRSKLAEEFGVNPEDEPELFDKLVAREQSHREKLSSAIKQKINWREKATTKSSTKPKENPKEGDTQSSNTLTEERLNQLLDEREAKRELEKLSLPEEVESEVRDIAKVRGISVGEALKLPYIQSRLEEVEREKRIQSATPKRSGKGSYTSSYDATKPLDPEDFDLGTEEGRKEWKEAKAARSKYLASQQ
jgi:hypothetical protein